MINWATVSESIKRMIDIEKRLEGEAQGLTKKERLQLTRDHEKLERALGGIRDMGGKPDILFVIDTNKESIAVAEARKLKIPIIAILDSNSNPENIDYPIPGNDDAGRAITLYCDLVSKAAIDGIARAQAGSGVDIGASEKPEAELLVDVEAISAGDEAAQAEASEDAGPQAADESSKETADGTAG